MTAQLYDEDLAFIQAAGFGEVAAAAAASIIPELAARGARRVVDVGCGAGVSTEALVAAGFDTLAIEPSAALLAEARRAAPSAVFRQASAYEFALDSCDAILAIGEALSYHAPSEDAGARLRDFFGKASQALGANGLLVFDLIETGSEPLASSHPLVRPCRRRFMARASRLRGRGNHDVRRLRPPSSTRGFLRLAPAARLALRRATHARQLQP